MSVNTWNKNKMGKILDALILIQPKPPRISKRELIVWKSFRNFQKFSKTEPFNRDLGKSLEANQMERKFPVINFRKFDLYISGGCPLLQKFKPEFSSVQRKCRKIISFFNTKHQGIIELVSNDSISNVEYCFALKYTQTQTDSDGFLPYP